MLGMLETFFGRFCGPEFSGDDFLDEIYESLKKKQQSSEKR